MPYYLAIKRNEILMNSVTWMTLENIMLRERSQKHKKSIKFIENVHNRQLYTENL